ncbi:uncharacterized protein LOC117330664 [Pecten maximus]|nr:uncharacterized protein LOC117330664 [Pecten maximus]
MVLIHNARKAATKKKGNLDPNYHGPYKVVNIDGKCATLQNDSGHTLKRKTNIDHLKLFKDQTAHETDLCAQDTCDNTSEEGTVSCMQDTVGKYIEDVSSDGSLNELFKFISELNLSKISLNTLGFQYHHCPQQSFLKEVISVSEAELECFGTLLLPHLRHLDLDLSVKTSVAMLTSAVCVMASHQFQPLMTIAQTLKEVPSHLEDVDIHEIPQLYPTQRLTVGGETLEAVDMATLEDGKWINDKVINSFLALKKMEQNTSESNRHIYVLPSYTAVQWDQGHLDHWMFKKVQFSKYTHVFLPICINGNHWVLLVADVKQRLVYVLDSMNGEVGQKWTRMWAEFMANRDRLPDVTEQFGVWNFPEIRSSKQTDSNSCGVFTLMNAECIAKDVPIAVMRQVHCQRYRQYVKASLLNAGAAKSDSKCDMPDCRIPKGHKRWVQCCVCGRWLHTKCCRIPTKAAIEEEYECCFCEAMYR